MIPVTYGYARVSKLDSNEKNLDTQLYQLDQHGIRRDLIYSDDITGMSFIRPGWNKLMEQVQPGDVIVVCNLARLGRHFEESVAIQYDLTKRGIWIISLQEGINTADENAGARFYRRTLLATGALHAESTSEQIKRGLDRARRDGKRFGRPPALSPERQAEARNIYARTKSIRATAKAMKVAQGTVKRALEAGQGREA